MSETADGAEYNLRHLRLFVAVVETGTATMAANLHNVSQPAVTQAIKRLETQFAGSLFDRKGPQLFPTSAGRLLADRVKRALSLLDSASEALAPRLKLTATTAKLRALIAVVEAENVSIAARKLGIAQPTVHRAIVQLESEISRPLFRRTHYGSVPTRSGRLLANAAQLAFAELRQAEMEIATTSGPGTHSMTIGGMPLSRSHLLPSAIAAFHQTYPQILVRVLEGPYDMLLSGLLRGEVDVLVGALRSPAPTADVVQQLLFTDELIIVSGVAHPLVSNAPTNLTSTTQYPWIVSPQGTPARKHFEDHIKASGEPMPTCLVETSSMILMREMLNKGPYLGCISRLQAASELRNGQMIELPIRLAESRRDIGLTTRAGWRPTSIQSGFIDLLRAEDNR